MSARLRIEGLDAFKDELTRLPKELGTEGKRIAKRHAEIARAAIRYPVHSGNLARGLDVVEVLNEPLAIDVRVVNTAPHAWIFEHGTEARHNDIHGGGGRMPPAHVFEPPVEEQQRAKQRALIELVERHGLKVSGGG